ncbi:MAG: hypothetical protein PHW96_02965 [Candidatus Nanoarchaeia archaeon]|nr:hypothetical protein [Candidatus Nanoarchaeia archaeon]
MEYTIKPINEGILAKVEKRGKNLELLYNTGKFSSYNSSKDEKTASVILNALSDNSFDSISSLAKYLGVSYKDAYKTAHTLEKSGLIEMNENGNKWEIKLPEYVKRELDVFENYKNKEISYSEEKRDNFRKKCNSELERILTSIKNKEDVNESIKLIPKYMLANFSKSCFNDEGEYVDKGTNIEIEPKIRLFKQEFRDYFKIDECICETKDKLIATLAKFFESNFNGLGLIAVCSSRGFDEIASLDEEEISLTTTSNGDSLPIKGIHLLGEKFKEIKSGYNDFVKILNNVKKGDHTSLCLSYGGGELILNISERINNLEEGFSYSISLEYYPSAINTSSDETAEQGVKNYEFSPEERIIKHVNFGKISDLPVSTGMKSIAGELGRIRSGIRFTPEDFESILK